MSPFLRRLPQTAACAAVLLLALLFAGFWSTSRAQTYVAYTQAAGTIATGNTFQTIVPANINRKFCLLQNTSTRIMYVYFGTLGSATLLNSFQVPANGSFSCGQVGDWMIGLAMSVTTSTTADPFVIAYVQ